MYGNGYSMAIVLDTKSTAISLTGNLCVFILVTGDLFLLVMHYLARPEHRFCYVGQEVLMLVYLKKIILKKRPDWSLSWKVQNSYTFL